MARHAINSTIALGCANGLVRILVWPNGKTELMVGMNNIPIPLGVEQVLELKEDEMGTKSGDVVVQRSTADRILVIYWAPPDQVVLKEAAFSRRYLSDAWRRAKAQNVAEQNQPEETRPIEESPESEREKTFDGVDSEYIDMMHSLPRLVSSS